MKLNVRTLWKRNGFIWATILFFLITLAGQWYFGWRDYTEQQKISKQPVQVKNYITRITSDTLENWQSEFLQVLWQITGLGYIFYLVSRRTRESEERQEKKIDLILKRLNLDPEDERDVKTLDAAYTKK